MRRIAALATTFTLALAFPAVAGGPNNVVKAFPTTDDAHVYRAAVKVTSTGADSIASTNLALAQPSGCTGCEGIAVAYQALIVTGNPSDVSPTNAAIAVNTECTSCGAFPMPTRRRQRRPRHAPELTGKAKIKDIREEANRLAHSGLPYPQLDSELTALAATFKSAVVDDLARAGAAPHGRAQDVDTDEAAPG